ncbi:MAG: hypothetical protein KC609_20115 [Myxococcales bacterium]|nr:hypothetical protein [Myxococcales bacterium]
MQKSAVAIALALALVSLVACSATRRKQSLLPPGAIDRKQLVAMVDVFPGQRWFRARYNPVICKCPHTEIEVGRRWVRVSLDPEDRERDAVRAYLKRAETDRRGGLVRTYRVFGKLDSELRHCGSRLYLTLILSRFELPSTP